MPTELVNELGEINVADFYDPQPKQEILHTNPAHNLLAIGGGGSGKSFFLLGEALYTCFQYPGANCLLLRRDFPQLERGLILDFKNTVPKELYHYNDSKHIVTFPNRSMLFFGHLQNGSERTLANYLSAAFEWIGVDELGQFSFEAWSFLSWRNRINKGCRPDMFGQMPIPRMGGATNPLGPGYGWIKQMWVDHKPVSQIGQTVKGKDGRFYQDMRGEMKVVFDPHDHVYVHSTVLDNPAQMAADPDYIRKLERLPPAMRQKALYGDLNAVAGQYFSNFEYERHVVSLPRDRARIKWEPWQPVWLGIDWGLAHHTAVYWFTRAQKLGLDGQWKNVVVCFRELVVNELDVDKLGERIFEAMQPPEKGETLVMKEIERCKFIFLSPEQFNRHGNTDHTVAKELGEVLHDKHELPHVSPANNRRVDGAVFIYNLLARGEFVLLEEACPHLIRTLQTVVRDEKNLEDVLKSDTLEDDCYDGFRYGMLSMLDERQKPQAIKEQEKINSIKDPTVRMMYAYQVKLKQEQRAKRKHQKPLIVPRWMKPNR
jgi:Terminase large subunit, T4likevirus-type, N-terminal